jgi:glycosyltransferase involved in cell wall biosynthesis
MMKSLGHTVYLYAGTQNEAEVDELITCLSEEDRLAYTAEPNLDNILFDTSNKYWQLFNNKAIIEMAKRIQQKDFICVIAGNCQKPVADFFPNNMTVEFGIGYTGTFAKYRVFESYAWMHSVYSAHKDPYTVDGKFYDTVIPGYLDPAMFPYQPEKGDYYLYIGRMIERKGVQIAAETCKEIGAKLILAGSGKDIPKYGEYIGSVGAEAQACGTPVITTDWGAFTETVVNGVTGYRCHTLDEFCKAAEDVKSLDPYAIHKRAVDLYSVDTIKYMYEKYFYRLMNLWGKGWYERS